MTLPGLGRCDGRLLTLSAVAATLFVALTVVVAIHPQPLPGDQRLAEAVQSCACAALKPFSDVIVFLTGLTEVIAGAVIVALVTVVRRRAFPYAVVSLGYALVYDAVVYAIQRPRPMGLTYTTPGLGAYSYPSGHAGFFLWVGVLAVVLLHRRLGRVATIALGAAALLLIVGASWSRIHVGAHWPSDVAGGLLLGIAWVGAAVSIERLRVPAEGGGRGGQFPSPTRSA
jgi:membrane-associated phospholipid phosphatase